MFYFSNDLRSYIPLEWCYIKWLKRFSELSALYVVSMVYTIISNWKRGLFAKCDFLRANPL